MCQRLVVYTAIFCGRDELKQPAFRPPGVDFVCFTEAAVSGGIWDVRPPLRVFADPARAVRYHKLRPFDVLPGYDAYIWLDGSLEITGDPREMAEAGGELAFFPHRERTCAFDEAEVVVATHRAPPKQVRQQMECYAGRGFPAKFGLWEAGAIVRRPSRRTRALSVVWWEQVRQHTCRDQLSLPYSLWSLGLRPTNLKGNVADNQWLQLHDHRFLPHSQYLFEIFGPRVEEWPEYARRHRQLTERWRALPQST